MRSCPECRKRASGPTCSATEVRKAMTSCFTSRSICVDAGDVEAAALLHRLGGVLRDQPELGHGLGG